ncbi:MAG TPA: hypothetical protein VG708_14720 [Mycobacteriales bacterium]|nr:hypothetical protein [Mycobacteriales bacterium]
MPRVGVPAHLRDVPFTWAQARAAGLTHSALRSDPWRHVLRDVWAHRDLSDTRAFRLEAAKLVLTPNAVCCGATAAWLFGSDVQRIADLDLRVSFPRGKRQRPRAGLVVCQETLRPSEIVSLGGVQLTSPLRTVFDCLRWLRDPEGLVVADALTHAGLVQLPELGCYLRNVKGLRNVRRARAYFDDIEPKAESPMETRGRVRLVRNGLPRPEAQIVVRDRNGRFVGRLDMGYREQLTAIEYDGADHWLRRREDDRRRDNIRALGWDVIVISADDVYSREMTLEAAVWRSLRRNAERSA